MICYTTDGSTPTATTPGTCSHGTTYSTSFSQAIPATVKAIGTAVGYTNSAVATNTYTLGGLAAPSISPVTGAYTSPQTVTITGVAGATFCYTSDGSAPTGNGAGSCTHGSTYSSGFSQVVPGTVKAIASKSGSADSGVTTISYTLSGAGRSTDQPDGARIRSWTLMGALFTKIAVTSSAPGNFDIANPLPPLTGNYLRRDVFGTPNAQTVHGGGSILTATYPLDNPGTGYVVGDVVSPAGGTGCFMTVQGVNGTGGITLLYWPSGGTGYTAGTVALGGGSGSGASVVISVSPAGSVGGGVDHPAGSDFCLVNQSIFKLALDSTLAGTTIFLKFTSYNTRGNMEQMTPDVPPYSFNLQGLLLGLYGYGYSVVPSIVLTQDASVFTTVDVAPFTIVSAAGNPNYIGTKITGQDDTGTVPLYIYVYDPAFRGENSALGITCRSVASQNQAYNFLAGWFYLGWITLLPGGGAVQGTGMPAFHSPSYPGWKLHRRHGRARWRRFRNGRRREHEL